MLKRGGKDQSEPGNANPNCSSCSSSTWTNSHRNHWAIYHSNQHSTYITNLTSICPNSTHGNRIEQKKIQHQRFRSTYLHPFLMEFNDLSCSVTYVPRSTRCIPLFHELEDSNSYLYEATTVKSSSSRLQWWKQMAYDDAEDEWRQGFSSTVLQLQEISNCHEHDLASTAAILAWIMHDLASIQHNNASRWMLEQEISKSKQEIRWKRLKKFERIWEIWENFQFGYEIVIVDLDFLLWLGIYTPVNPTC